jgi:hypothetical protein
VWEWTAASDGSRQAVGRGGSFYLLGAYASSDNRAPDSVEHRDAFYGIRVCADAPAP